MVPTTSAGVLSGCARANELVVLSVPYNVPPEIDLRLHRNRGIQVGDAAVGALQGNDGNGNIARKSHGAVKSVPHV